MKKFSSVLVLTALFALMASPLVAAYNYSNYNNNSQYCYDNSNGNYNNGRMYNNGYGPCHR